MMPRHLGLTGPPLGARRSTAARGAAGQICFAALTAVAFILALPAASSAQSFGSWTGTVTLDDRVTSGGETPFGGTDTRDRRMVASATITGADGPADPGWKFYPLNGSVDATLSEVSAYTSGENAGRCDLTAHSLSQLDSETQSLRLDREQLGKDVFRLGQFGLNFSGVWNCSGDSSINPPEYETGEGYQEPFPDYDYGHPDPDGGPFPLLAASGPGGPEAGGNGDKRWRGSQTFVRQEPEYGITRTSTWTWDLTYHPRSKSQCKLKADASQQVKKALAATVKAGSSPCEAKVKSVKFKVGNKVYANVKKKPSKTVPANGSWKLEFPINGKFEKTVKKALKAKKPVLGKIVADLSGQEDSITVRVK